MRLNAEVVVVFFVFVVTALSVDFVLHCNLAVELKILTVVVDCHYGDAHFATVEYVFVVILRPAFELLLPEDLLLFVLCF